MTPSPQPDLQPDPQAIASVPVRGVLDAFRAEPTAARIRSAMRNGFIHIEVDLAADVTFASDAFLGFLLTTARWLRAQQGTLRIRCRGDATGSALRFLGAESELILIESSGDAP
jgi:anti-anti-sigma regulatory factor